MMTSRCGRRNVYTAIKITFAAFLFVLAVQITYLHTHRADERREDHVSSLVTTRGQVQKQDKPMDSVPPLKYFPDLFFKPPYQPLVHGKPRPNKGFLTIAIPSVQRPNTERIYLYDTLDSIIEKTPAAEQHQITIVVMISDRNKTYNHRLSTDIYDRYGTFCDNGMIHVLNTIDCIYPDLDNVKQTFKDSKARLKWRAKQNIDFAFMMLYSRNLSDFYLQLEDDVVVATDFIQDIRTFIQKNTQNWFLLEFSRLGFIGKLFRSMDLDFASKFLLNHFDLAPGDLLLGAMRVEKGQKKSVHSNTSLFQHIGRFSSLKNKLMPSLDNTFKDAEILDLSLDLPSGDNPPAIIETSLSAYENHIPEHAYDNDITTFFWAKSPAKNDDFVLIFEKLYNFSRIIIPTGIVGTKRDSFLYSNLEYTDATPLQASNNKKSCVNKFVKLEDMVDGDIDTMATGTLIPLNIKCLRIKATRRLRNWVVIRDIQLFLRP